MTFANKYAEKDCNLRVAFIYQGNVYEKSDAFLLSYNGEYLLIDGGMRGTDAALNYLLATREELIGKNPEVTDSDCKLKINLLISHFHVDHIYALLTHVIPSEFVYINKIYLPPDSDLAVEYGERGVDGDSAYRTLFAEALEKYQPQARVIDIPFGKENITDFEMSGYETPEDKNSPKLRIYPPNADWGSGERLDFIINGYYDGDKTKKMIATAVVNAACIWLRLTYGEVSFLFTGDSLKKRASLKHESCDEMMETYGEDIGKVTVLKFPHHGVNRENAAREMLTLCPEYIVSTTVIETAQGAVKALYRGEYPDGEPDTAPDGEELIDGKCEIKFYNSGYGTVIFTTDGTKENLKAVKLISAL